YDLPEIEQGLYQREQKERPYYHEEYQRDRYIDQYYRLPEPVSYYRSGEGRRYRVPDSREVPYYYDDYFLSGRDPAADRINNGYPPYPPYRY
ncbi:MAG: hypothetical protein FWE66_01190, partial [Oscillospiraceae bacterium]|nr:hypothetical protein [Oscillospiraceae bacterium]